MHNFSMSQDQVMLKIAPDMRCIEVPLSGVMLSSSLIKTTEKLYLAFGPDWGYMNPSSGFPDTRIKIFYENGVEIPLGSWEHVVHAGMVVVIEFIPTVTDRRWSEPACLDDMPQTPSKETPISRAEETPISPIAMSPPHKSVSLERYPSSKPFTQNRPGNTRIHNSLPSISEQSNQTADDDQYMFPRSVTPLPSPQPWKLLFNRAKSRGLEKNERDYFSNRPVQPTLARRWSEPTWVSAEEFAVQAEVSQQCLDTTMDIDMSGADIIEERTYEVQPKEELLAWGGYGHQTATIQPATDLFTLQPPVSFTSKRKRGYGTDSEDDGEDVCRRTIKRTMASYHRPQLHGVLQAV